MVPGENNLITHITSPLDLGAEQDDTMFYFNVRDITSIHQSLEKVEVKMPPKSKVAELVDRVTLMCLYDSFSVEVLFLMKNGECLVLNDNIDKTLEELNFTSSLEFPNNLTITDKKDCLPKKLNIYLYKDSGNDEKNEAVDSAAVHVPPPAPPPFGCKEEVFRYSTNNTSTKTETGFVGLFNQAMTCYLNSLLQTLYMTPEFRNALYRWEFEKTEDEGSKSIPYQLQKLFLLLQTSKKFAVGTTQLTTSFGWDSSEAWQQHDVQELCRVMFDALEKTFKDTEQSNLISTLYEGKLKDYVKCLECGYESAREDTFLDVPLVVRPFGSNEAYASVEEALHAFVTPETLQGCNQYFCERCKKKCNAHKGLKFAKFPYLLTLQLKRFDFDPVTMHRIKLNDKVTFPEILDINEFIPEEKLDVNHAGGDSGLGMADKVAGGISVVPPAASPKENHVDDDEGIDVGITGLPHPTNTEEISTNEKNTIDSIPKGPYLYELFSIMVHSGSANGGHYYAYIKSLKDGDWYCFNDSQVTRITYDDIQKTYGGGPSRGYYSSAYSSSINAYLLMYRQIDKAKNAEFMSMEAFPDHIKTLLENMLHQEEMDRKRQEMDKYMCKIKLYYQHPEEKNMIEMKLKVHKDTTLMEATKTARTLMGIGNSVPLDCSRLIKYDDFHDSLECSFVNSDDEPIGNLLGGVRSSYKFDLLLEIKQPHEEFQVYTLGGTTVKVHVVNLEREEVAPVPIIIRSHFSDTVEDLQKQIAKALGANVEMLRLATEHFGNEVKLLHNPAATLKSLDFCKSSKVFAEFRDEEDSKKDFLFSKFNSTLDSYFHTICIQIVLPKVDKEILEKFKIQENEVDNGEESEEEAEVEKILFTKREFQLNDKRLRRVEGCPSPEAEVSVKFRPQYPVKRNKNFACYNSSSSLTMLNKKASVVTPDDSSQECDEGLGDSEIGDSCSMSGYPSSHAVHSDQSEDSSLTDSERTLVGDELSPRNNSPDIMGTDMEIDADPGQPLSPDTSRPDSDSAHSSSDSNFQADDPPDDLTNPSSPEESGKDTKCYTEVHSAPEVVTKRCFRAYPFTDCETSEKTLRVYMDKRMTLAALKTELEPFVGVGPKYFKIYRVYTNDQEMECTRLKENLMSYTDDTRLIVKLGRNLRKGEYKVKIYQLCINDSEPCRHLLDWVFVRGMTVLSAKKEILPILKDSCSLDIPLNRCRLRMKCWKNPGRVFLDDQRFDKEITVNTNWEVFLEVLEDAEPVISPDQITVFLKRWHPSTFVLDRFQEVVLDSASMECFVSKISEVSGIPKENVEFANISGSFPCEVSLVAIDGELTWSVQGSQPLTMAPGDDGHVIYYRDGQEELKKLSEEEKREIINKENARSNKGKKVSCSPRKEKALKIYTQDSSPRKTSSPSTSSTASNGKATIPDHWINGFVGF